MNQDHEPPMKLHTSAPQGDLPKITAGPEAGPEPSALAADPAEETPCPAPSRETDSPMPPSQGAEAPSPIPSPARRHVSASLVVGIGILFLGTVLMLENFGIRGAHYLWRLWPLIIVALGIIKLRNAKGSRTGAYMLLAIGSALSLSTIFGIDLGSLLGPLFVMGIGIFIMLHALKKHRQSPPSLKESEDFIKGMALFSSYRHRHPRSPFKGGELTAIFGGTEVDLRDAQITSQSVRLDCFIMFGGGEIRVPEGWDVRVSATAIFGGIDNKSIPLPNGAQGKPVLSVTGMVLFGGMEIKA